MVYTPRDALTSGGSFSLRAGGKAAATFNGELKWDRKYIGDNQILRRFVKQRGSSAVNDVVLWQRRQDSARDGFGQGTFL